MRGKGILGVALSLLLMTGCGGGGNAGGNPAVAPPAQASGPASLSFSIHIPTATEAARARASHERHASYISPSTMSATIQIDSNAPIMQNAAGPTISFNNVSISVGTHTVTAITYQGLNATGNQLSTGVNPSVTIVPGGNTLGMTLAGIPEHLRGDLLAGESAPGSIGHGHHNGHGQ